MKRSMPSRFASICLPATALFFAAGERPLFRDALILSTLLFAVFPVHAAHEAGPFHLGVATLRTEVGHQPGPQPPCGNEPIPSYPALKDSATVKSWAKTDFGRDWKPPACTTWAKEGFTTLVTISARFSSTAEAEGLLRHIGAISERAGMRYWSTTHKQWEKLVLDAYALTEPEPGQRRADFASEELKQGKVLYFEQVDNLSGKATYRMHIIEASASRLVIGVENITTMRYHFI
ncbi:MAG TPA: DUF6675 family protein, partial [Terriglobales bacterium]|nr:DUF6675 family protein [Terriglobales bacterium]